MQSYSIFGHTSVKQCMQPIRIPLLQASIPPFFKFMTITDSIDVYYYLFGGKEESYIGELAQMIEHSLSTQEVLISIPRFSTSVQQFIKSHLLI